MFKKLKQKISEESEGEQSPLRQHSREGQVRTFDKLYAWLLLLNKSVSGTIICQVCMSCFFVKLIVKMNFILVSLRFHFSLPEDQRVMEMPPNLRRIPEKKRLQLLEGKKKLRHQQPQIHKPKRSRPHEKFLIEFIIFSMSRYGLLKRLEENFSIEFNKHFVRYSL